MTTLTDQIAHDTFGTFPPASTHRLSRSAAAALLDNIVTALLDWQERARQRRQLLALGDGALKDFGRSRADAAGEGGKPFWRA